MRPTHSILQAPTGVSDRLSDTAPLPHAERLFLWAIRAWSANHTDLSVVWWSLDRAFTQEKIPQALPPLHRSLTALFAGLKRWPDIRCVACVRLGADESRLLSMFAHLQLGNVIGARHVLQDWVMRPAARLVCEHALECAAIAAAAGIRFASLQASASRETASVCIGSASPSDCGESRTAGALSTPGSRLKDRNSIQ